METPLEPLELNDELVRCRCELHRLLEENAALRYASLSFGELADRLNSALKSERRARAALQHSVTSLDPPLTDR